MNRVIKYVDDKKVGQRSVFKYEFKMMCVIGVNVGLSLGLEEWVPDENTAVDPTWKL